MCLLILSKPKMEESKMKKLIRIVVMMLTVVMVMSISFSKESKNSTMNTQDSETTVVVRLGKAQRLFLNRTKFLMGHMDSNGIYTMLTHTMVSLPLRSAKKQ